MLVNGKSCLISLFSFFPIKIGLAQNELNNLKGLSDIDRNNSFSSSYFQPFAWEAREFVRKRLIGKEVMFTIEYKPPGSTREYGCVYLQKGRNYTNTHPPCLNFFQNQFIAVIILKFKYLVQ